MHTLVVYWFLLAQLCSSEFHVCGRTSAGKPFASCTDRELASSASPSKLGLRYGNSTRHFRRDLVTATGVPIPTSALTYDTISPIMNPQSPPTPSSSASTSTAPGSTTSPSNADLTVGKKAGISAGVVVGACGIGILILLLIRRRGNGHNQHNGHGDEKEGYPEPQLPCDGHTLPEESTRAEMDAVPAMQKIYELPPAENAQVCSVAQAPSADHPSAV